MTLEQNKQLVQQFFELFSAADIPAATGLLDDNIIWRVMGREGGPPMSNEMDKAGIAELIQVVDGMFPKGLKFEYLGWTAEAERVAVEIESYGEKANGTVYNNPYHFLVKISDNKITEIKEYLDTLHVKSVFVDDQ